MAKKVAAAVLLEPRKIDIREFDLPNIGPEEGILKIEMVGVCATDVSIYQGKIKFADLPLILGHEVIGYIEQIGLKASKLYGVKEGDRVIVETCTSCGHCLHCLNGNYTLCENNILYGLTNSAKVPPYLWGGYAEFMYLAPNSHIHQLPSEITPKTGILISACIGNSVRWVIELGGAKLGDSVLIEGVGPQGLGCTIVAKEAGCFPIIVSGLTKDIERFKLAKEFGADYLIDVQKDNVIERVKEITKGKMVNVVLDVSGSIMGVATSLHLVRKKGTIVNASMVGGEMASINPDIIVNKEITYRGAYSQTFESVQTAINIAKSKKYPIEKIVTHLFPLQQADNALKMAEGNFEGGFFLKCAIKP